MPLIRMLGHREVVAAIEAVRAELAIRRDAAVSDAYGELIALLRMDKAPVSAVYIGRRRSGRPSTAAESPRASP